MDKFATAPPVHLAIFASGAGTNAKKIMEHFERSDRVRVALVVCNNPQAGVLRVAAEAQIPVLLISRKIFNETGYLQELERYHIDFVVLAGFLWKVPPVLVEAYRGHIVNIHPTLLPRYGGKGMYGDSVHEAVLRAGEKESGITIHYVDELYDHGAVIFQATCAIAAGETPATLAAKIHALEHRHYPEEIEKIVAPGGI